MMKTVAIATKMVTPMMMVINENCIDVDNGDGVDEMSDTSDFC